MLHRYLNNRVIELIANNKNGIRAPIPISGYFLRRKMQFLHIPCKNGRVWKAASRRQKPEYPLPQGIPAANGTPGMQFGIFIPNENICVHLTDIRPEKTKPCITFLQEPLLCPLYYSSCSGLHNNKYLHPMINQYEVPAMIEDTLPELSRPLHQFPAIFHIYETMQCLGSYVLRQLRDRNYPLLEKSLRLTVRLYEKGNPLVQRAVLQVIIPGLSRESIPDNIGKIRLYSLIPPSLYNSFMQHHLQ